MKPALNSGLWSEKGRSTTMEEKGCQVKDFSSGLQHTAEVKHQPDEGNTAAKQK